MMRRIIFILIGVTFLNLAAPIRSFAYEDEVPDVSAAIEITKDVNIELESPSAVLMEGSTGKIIYQKGENERLKPASVTKVMTLLLIFEAIESGQISLNDEITISDFAASMGGSQVFLEANEIQTVDTLIKCISIASANDASVAMSEAISGSEEEFASLMNIRAKELGMKNTNFINCTGLDADNHYTTSLDIALMSRELIINHPQISNYSTVWMDTFVHKTRRGEEEFGLSNTNRLIRSYDGITGLKTGSTSLAKYCLSATAKRNGMDLIAVILAAPDTKTRFGEAAKLLNYGFANYNIYKDDHKDTVIEPISIKKGTSEVINGIIKEEFSYLHNKSINTDEITNEIIIDETLEAPIMENDIVGEIHYFHNKKKIGSVNILAKETVKKAKFKDTLLKALKNFFKVALFRLTA